MSKALGLTWTGTREDAVAAGTVRVVAERRGAGGVTRVVESVAGPVMAAAGVDASNTGPSQDLLLLPEDPDAEAGRLRAQLLDAPRTPLCDSAGRRAERHRRAPVAGRPHRPGARVRGPDRARGPARRHRPRRAPARRDDAGPGRRGGRRRGPREGEGGRHPGGPGARPAGGVVLPATPTARGPSCGSGPATGSPSVTSRRCAPALGVEPGSAESDEVGIRVGAARRGALGAGRPGGGTRAARRARRVGRRGGRRGRRGGRGDARRAGRLRPGAAGRARPGGGGLRGAASAGRARAAADR